MSSIGKDLVTIRTHLGFTIQDIQNATKIPLTTLKAIESGAIFEQTEEIKTYVRSFVRSYGRAIKLDDDLIVSALDQQETGNYNHLLLNQFPELAPHEPEIEDTEPTAPPMSKKDEPIESEEKPASTSRFVADFPEEEEEQNTEYTPTPPPGVRNVNWADMGKRFSSQSQKTPVWVIGAVVVIVVVFAGAYFLFQNNFFISDDMDIEPPATAQDMDRPEAEGSELSLDVTSEPPADIAELQDTLYLTVYAAVDQLNPVRVWSDLKPRIDPYWIEDGVALNFEFSDSIRVRGQYSRMLLFLNGHLIENFRQEYFNSTENSVELTRGLFENDPKWATPVPFELPPNIQEPDSIANRPTFR